MTLSTSMAEKMRESMQEGLAIEEIVALDLITDAAIRNAFDPRLVGDGKADCPVSAEQLALFKLGFVMAATSWIGKSKADMPLGDGWLEGTPERPGYYQVYGESLREKGVMLVSEGHYDGVMELWLSPRVNGQSISHYKPLSMAPGYEAKKTTSESTTQQAKAWTDVYRFCFANGMGKFSHMGNATQRVIAWIGKLLKEAGAKR